MPNRLYVRTGMPWLVGWTAMKLLLALAYLLLLGWLTGPSHGDPGPSQSGPGDLLVVPTRIVFEGRDRNAEISLVRLAPRPRPTR